MTSESRFESVPNLVWACRGLELWHVYGKIPPTDSAPNLGLVGYPRHPKSEVDVPDTKLWYQLQLDIINLHS